MSRPIVVGLALREDDAAPLALGRLLARLTGAPLALVSAYPGEHAAAIASPEHALAAHQEVHDRVVAVADGLLGEHEVTAHVRLGPPADALRDVAAHGDALAIVVGSTHRGVVGRVLLGDIAAQLTQIAPCPIAVAPRGYVPPAGRLDTIGAAFVDTRGGHAALDAAAELAGAAGSRVAALTVVEPFDWVGGSAIGAPPVRRSLERAALETAADACFAAVSALPARLQATSSVLEGIPAEQLAGASEQLDLLVIGSRGHGAVRAALAGGVSRRLAHAPACPLLVLPAGVRMPHVAAVTA